ncbi:MAG TPA: hypothetical protein VFS43_36345 [Polyangiaceae bacterium]|nr:hypothetical protein [Polyangiaceae bacterium]
MKRAALAAPLALAASALCAHCSSEEGWDSEGRVYVTLEAAVTRSTVSLFDRPVDAGDAVYAAAFEIPGGFPRQPWSDARVFVEFPPGVSLGDGDEPVFCAEYAASDQLVLRRCEGLASGSAGTLGAGLSVGQTFRYWLAELPRAIDVVDVRRVSLEVRRPEAGPSLEAAVLKLWIIDGSCDQALAARSNAAACNAEAGDDCSWVAETTLEVDDVICRMRRRPD